MNKYEYIGAVECSGTLDNGEKWSGLRACFASLRDDKPFAVKVFKASRSCADIVRNLSPGERVALLFDERGRLADVLD